MAGFSSDGDTRLLMAMRHHTHFNFNSSFNSNGILCIQDTIHELAKLRCRVMKPSILLPMGNKQVSIAHLKLLIKNVPKGIHGLVLKDVCPDDKQNYRSIEKLMETRVLDALTANIIDSEATVTYIKLMQKIASSFLEPNISPIDRVAKIWYAVYFVRIWRQWIKANGYSLTDNFMP